MLSRRKFAKLGLGVGAMGVTALVGCESGVPPKAIEGSLIRGVTFSSGGGEMGGYESIELERQEDGSVTLSTRERPWHNARETGMDFVVDPSAFDRFAQIANDYDLRKASERELSEYVVLDAPTSRISYYMMGQDGTYDPDATFSVSDDQDLSEKEWEGFREVQRALAELAASSEGVPYEEPIGLTLILSGVQYHFYLNDSDAALELARRCPFDAELGSQEDDERVFGIGEDLPTEGAPLATGAIGTLCYRASSRDVVFFYRQGAPSEGLFELGQIEDDYDVQFLAEEDDGELSVWSTYYEE